MLKKHNASASLKIGPDLKIVKSEAVLPVETAKCLIVDDLTENILALRALLQGEKVEIHSARTADEALELLLQHDYALSLIDVHMPDINGFELAELMRSLEKTKSTPIIFVTAASSDIFRIFKGYEAGAVDFLQKPLYPQIVQGKVRIFIELYNQKKKLEERTKALQIANQEIEAFSYSVSHDLKTPLRNMEGFSRLLLNKHAVNIDEKGKEYLNCIYESSRKMEELINGMLMLSKIGLNELERSELDLSEMINKVIQSRKINSPDREISVQVTPHLRAYADPGLCMMVVENIINNAWKYTSKNPAAQIQIGSGLYQNREVIFVKDNGIGFDMNYVSKIFEPFQRLHSDTQFPGNGIGLAIVKRVIDRHNGVIWVESKENQGTTFYFAF